MKTTDLSQKAKDYLTLRFSLGYKVNNADRNLLQGFITFAEQRGLPITTEMTLNWACGSPRVGDATCAWRISRLRGFLTFLKAFQPETEVPGQGLLAKVHRRPPYIYSAEEIVKLLQAAQHIKDRGLTCFTLPSRTLRAHTCETLFGLLVSTSDIRLVDLDAQAILEFLSHLENKKSARSALVTPASLLSVPFFATRH